MGQVCAKHQEFYETACRYCDPVATTRPVCNHNKSGVCAGCGADILRVSAQMPVFKKVLDLSMAEYLGAEKIGPQESKFWMDFISQEFCKADIQDLSESPLDRHGGCE